MMKILFILPVLALAGCSAPQTCEQLALQSANNALNQTVDKLHDHYDYLKYKNMNNKSGTYNTTTDGDRSTGRQNVSGKYSESDYTGLGSREAYEETLNTCNKNKV
jgi:outer membrane murein-binding lipoprotein Lpp